MSSAKIIADSISEQGVRITTLELSMPRFILSQFNTHRMFSRSAQSSRAVPVQKMIDALNSDDAPTFRQSQKGMQAGEILDAHSFAGHEAKRAWIEAKSYAVLSAKELRLLGVAKEITNRLIEPFSTVKVVVTATEWDNFFKLRLHHAAQPEMQELAQAMRDAMDESVPSVIENTNPSWHLPYISQKDAMLVKFDAQKLALVSAARCARVSYLNHDNSNPDIEKDLELARQLLADGHLSPLEHQAKPIDDNAKEWQKGVTHIDYNAKEWSGNFRGWLQHRQLIGDTNNG